MIEIVDFRNKTLDEIPVQDNPACDFKKNGDYWERKYECILIVKTFYNLLCDNPYNHDDGYLVVYCPIIKTEDEPKLFSRYKIIDQTNLLIIGIFSEIDIAVDIANFYSENNWRLKNI